MFIKNLIKFIFRILIRLMIFLFEKLHIYGFFSKIFVNYNDNKIQSVKISNSKILSFYTPNILTTYRVKTFFSKEPNTIKWIDNFKKNSFFLDIGSNIGLYSCYAATKKNCNVISFDPSVFNTFLLAKNINLNKLENKISIMPLPLINKKLHSEFKMSDISIGGALSSFYMNFSHDGKKIKKNFSYKTFGINIDDFLLDYKIKKPDYIKIDVDGIEHLILKGGSKALKNCKSLLIEVNMKFNEQYKFIQNFMKKNKFTLVDQSRLVSNDKSEFYHTYNQIWKNNKFK